MYSVLSKNMKTTFHRGKHKKQEKFGINLRDINGNEGQRSRSEAKGENDFRLSSVRK